MLATKFYRAYRDTLKQKITPSGGLDSRYVSDVQRHGQSGPLHILRAFRTDRCGKDSNRATELLDYGRSYGTLRTVGDAEQRIPETVRQAVIQVCRNAVHWKSDMRSIFLDAGVPEAMYDRYDIEENPKARIARFVFSDLGELGARGITIERKIVEELCRWERPHREAPDQALGRAALDELKQVATANQILVDPEKAAAQLRRERTERERRHQDQRQQRLGAVRDHYYKLSRNRPRTRAELQQRGYGLEALLADLFETSDIQYRRPYRATHEQIDGSFRFRGM